MRLAAISFELRGVSSIAEFLDHVDEATEEAYCANADWMILPEYFSLELLTLPEIARQPDGDQLKAAAGLFPEIDLHMRTRTQSAGFSIVAGSSLFDTGNGLVNRGAIYSDSGEVWYADKQVLTQFELSPMKLVSGHVWSQPISHGVGAMVCYDSEFPEGGRALAEAGALVIAIPTFTETAHGHHRVRIGAQARALENQVFTAMASLIGTIGREPVPLSVGRSMIFAPPIEPFPDTGVLAETAWNTPGVAIADLDFDELLERRDDGDVRNWNDRSAAIWTISTE